jgi:glycosyltransferase involved in cell wall biosynthesis
MKVCILFKLTNFPAGGGNQFLKALRTYFNSIRVYEEDVKKADVVLFNSHQYIDEVARYKLKYPGKLFVHRIDGPMKLYNIISDRRDDIVYMANKYFADATIFQSKWSQTQNHMLGLAEKPLETVIHNAPDPSIFNRGGRVEFSTNRKIRLIATSWSDNWNKGFEVYCWLDGHLDFNKYEMVFVGNSPVLFKNIKHILLLDSIRLAEQVKKSDIFIIASKNDPCSNSLIEALHCGLPVIAFADGGHLEVASSGGEFFTAPEQIPRLLEKIIRDYAGYQANIANPTIEQIGKQYCDFLTRVYCLCEDGQFSRRAFRYIDYCKIRTAILFYKFYERVNAVFSNRA